MGHWQCIVNDGKKEKKGEVGEKKEKLVRVFFLSPLNNTKRYGSSGLILPHGPETGHCTKLKLGQNWGHNDFFYFNENVMFLSHIFTRKD